MKPAASRLLHALAIAVFATMVLLAPSSASAQEARGTITGKVRDASDAVMPGAQVRITDVARGTTVSVTTNDAGLYQAPYLLPGTYQIVVEVNGFKKYVRGGVVLRIGDTLDIPVQLEIGQTSDTITVSAETPALDTTSASMGQTVDSRRIAELPLVHGDPYTLIGLSAGVNFGRDPKLDRPFEPTHIVGFTMDGTRANRSDLTIDGVPSTATANANEVIATYVPPTDIIQEFKVQTATFDSQFGNTEGGVTSISIKSGTNSLHGTGYFFGEPGSLAANDFFANRAGQDRPSSFSNRYGGSVGGPVYIPRLYNGKNKTFFLFGFERIVDARPRNNGEPTVATQAMKNGDFSAFSSLGAAYQLFNPFTRRTAPNGRFQEDPFMCDPGGNPIAPLANGTQVGGTPCNKIPTQLFNPVSKALLQFFPDPTTPGSAAPDGKNNFLQPGLKERAKYYSSTMRVDHNISDKHRIFGRASWYDRNSTYNNYFNNLATGTLFQFISRQGALDDVYTFNSTTVLNVRYGYNRFIRVDGNNPAGRGFDLTSVGFPASYNNSIPADRRAFPRLDIAGYQGTGFNNEPRPIDTHSVIATLNKTLGAHSLKGGSEYRIYRENSISLINDVTGRFNFDSSFTRGPLDNAGGAADGRVQSFAAFLLGIPSTSNSYLRRPSDYAEESTTWGFFIQDDWRFNSRLTLNMGLRYEFETPLKERFNRSVSGFDFNFVQPLQGEIQAKYASDPKSQTPEITQLLVRGGVTFPGVNGLSDGLYETPKNNVMPRFGLAFKWNDKTVIRAGYGIFFGFLGQRRGDVNQAGFSRDTPLVQTVNGDGVTFLFPNGQTVFSNPFPTILEPVGAAQGAQTFLGQSVTFFNQKPLVPYNQRWELGFQRELTGGWVAEASYVGNRGTHIEISRNINATPQRFLSQLNSYLRDETRSSYLSANLTTNPFNKLSTPIPGIGSSTNIARERLLRPFPQFDQVNTTTNEGYSWYHSLQTRIEKRFSKGYTFQASYTYSKFMQATEVLNQDDIDPLEVISDADYPHRFAASGIYELPFGKGQKFLDSSNGIVSRLVGGWQFQGVYTFQSGAPISFGNISYAGDLTDITLPGDQQSPEQWFNTTGFVALRQKLPSGSFAIVRNANGVPVLVDFNDPCKNSFNATSCPGTPLANPVGFNRDPDLQLDRNVRRFPMRFGFLRYPRQNNFDLSLVKNTTITETMKLQFRAELINAFNRAWLANPNGTNGLSDNNRNPTSATFGQITGSTGGNYARRVQLGLKLVF
jgi:Carboxypeptidase regulatory-like domain